MGRLCIVETLGAGLRVHQRRLAVLDLVVAAVDEGREQSRSAEALPPLTGEGVVGGVLSVLHARLVPHAASDRAAASQRAHGAQRALGGPASSLALCSN